MVLTGRFSLPGPGLKAVDLVNAKESEIVENPESEGIGRICCC
jgi:hypothetical protein